MTSRQNAFLTLVAALLVAVFAGTRYMRAKAHLHQHQWTLLSLPMKLVPGERITATVNPDATADYDIRVRLRWPDGGESAPGAFRCDSGANAIDGATCPRFDPPLQIAISAKAPGGLNIAQQSPTTEICSSGRGHSELCVGSFRGTVGQPVQVLATVDGSGAMIRNFRPELVVRLEPMRFKQAFASAQIDLLLGLASASVAACLAGLSAWFFAHSRRIRRSD